MKKLAAVLIPLLGLSLYVASLESPMKSLEGFALQHSDKLPLATVERTDLPADLVMDSADLAAAYLGGVRPVELAAAGRIVEATPGAVRRASALFATEHVAWCATMF